MRQFSSLTCFLLATSHLCSLAVPGIPAGDLERIRQAAPADAPAPPIKPRHLLVFTLAQGFVHDATPWGVAALQIVGAKTGAYTMLATEDPEVFEQNSLARFDAVCFLNTCFTPFTNAVLQQNLMDFVKGGKGYVGIHSSAHTFLDWEEFGQLQGAYSVSHPWHEQVTVTIEEPDHPLMRCFGGSSFVISDEIYRFDQRYSRQRLRVLASLDTSRTDMTKPDITLTDRDFGLVWIQSFGQGRSFYSAFGHDKHVFWDPTVLKHYLAGIQFAFGDLAADATPSAQLPDQQPPPSPSSSHAAAYRRVHIQRMPAPPEADTTVSRWTELKQYVFTGSRSILVEVEALVRDSLADAALQGELERQFVALLQDPDTTAAAKEFLCWQLRLIGSANSVPALATLLSDDQLSDSARIALQENPAPAAGQALRMALSTASDRQLIGIMNSLAVRCDSQAVAAFRELAEHDSTMVAAAAITGLGQIGGAEALNALQALWVQAHPVEQRLILGDALLRCADRWLAEGQDDRALAVYRQLFDDPNSPHPVRLAAAVGFLTQQKHKALDTVVQFLSGADPALHKLAVRHIRLLPGETVTRQLSAQLDTFSPPVRIKVVRALGERRDTAAAATLIQTAASEHAGVRLAALAGLAHQEGTPASVARLLDTAAFGAGSEQAVARDSLIRLHGPRTDDVLLAQMDSGTVARRVETIQAIGHRGFTEAVTALFEAARDSAPAVRMAAIRALGQVAGSAEYPPLVDLLTEIPDSQEREAAARAIEAVALRIDSLEHRLKPLVDRLPQASIDTTVALLPILATIGGPAALEAVQSAARRDDAPVIQNAAIRTLADWSDASALNALRSIIPSTTNTTSRTLALRGFIRLIGLRDDSRAEQKVADYRQALAWSSTLDEKRLILAGLADVPHSAALELAGECSEDPAVQTEAALTAQKIRKALDRAIETER
jgi:uncharacterized protein